MSTTKVKHLPSVLPEKCSEQNVVNNVVYLINDYIPNTTNSKSQASSGEFVVWLKFEECDINDFESRCNTSQKPLIILVGTSHGLQIWSVPYHGECVLLYSSRGHYVHRAKILSSPRQDEEVSDCFATRRPILASSERNLSMKCQYSVLKLFSLRTNEELRSYTFKSDITDIQSNKSFLVVQRLDCITILSIYDLQKKFSIINCRPAIEDLPSPIALGSRWLAFAAIMRVHSHKSQGGDTSDDDSKPIATTVMNAKKRIWGSLSTLGSTFAESVVSTGFLLGGSVNDVTKMASKKHPRGSRKPPNDLIGFQPPLDPPFDEDEHTGMVTVVNLVGLLSAYSRCVADCPADDPEEGEVDASVDVHVLEDNCKEKNWPVGCQGIDHGPPLVAHFQAHRWVHVTNLKFNMAGVLLVTAGAQGHAFNVFRISAHPNDVRQTAVHHLYTLVRGATPCSVVDICISRDSRWVSVSSNHGTTHLFPITPYGGPVTVRTHTQLRVVNRTSRYHKSAGLEEMDLLRPTLTRASLATTDDKQNNLPASMCLLDAVK